MQFQNVERVADIEKDHEKD